MEEIYRPPKIDSCKSNCDLFFIYKKILPFPFIFLNVENNHLGNQIPEALGRLHNLSVLVLSRNQFSGHIPQNIGNISKLRQLDLSLNNLSGEIPVAFDNLRSLSFFNVSHNNLSGPVPTLLAQKFNSSSFVGNIQLCGYSPSTTCPSLAPSG